MNPSVIFDAAAAAGSFSMSSPSLIGALSSLDSTPALVLEVDKVSFAEIRASFAWRTFPASSGDGGNRQ